MISIRERGHPCSPATLSLAVCLVACFALPAGAVDSSDCAVCHEELTRTFETTMHGRILGFETADGQTGCVTCHGDGEQHIDSGGERDKIRGLNAETPVEQISEVCMTCHRSESLNDWHGSAHPLAEVGCSDCHQVHATADQQRKDPAMCISCHTDVRSQFQYPSHHPLREGHMNCGSCHDPHGNSAGMLANEERPQELCLTCHTHLQGPFVFEHEPVFEGCETCHSPHGSVADNLLVQNEPFLCLQCHEMHFHAGLEGEPDTEAYVPAFDPAFDPTTVRPTYPGGMVPNPGRGAGYKLAFTTKCTQCHTQVHGSDQPSQTVPGLGRGLMR